MEEYSDERSALSAGLVIFEALSEDVDVKALASRVYPVMTTDAKLPCIFYRRASLDSLPTKSSGSARHAAVEIFCCSSDYSGSVDMAEAVRRCLDGQNMEGSCGLRIRSCQLVDSDEDWQDDAFIQRLIFNIGI